MSPLVSSPSSHRRFLPRRFIARCAFILMFCVASLHSRTANAQYFFEDTPVGSWQTSLEIPAFGNAVTTVLLSFTADGVVIETDTPTAGSFFFGSSALANGHGAWKRTGRDSFEYVYIKEIYAGTSAQGVALGFARSTATAVISSDRKKLQISNVSIVFTAADGSVLARATGSGTASKITFGEQ